MRTIQPLQCDRVAIGGEHTQLWVETQVACVLTGMFPPTLDHARSVVHPSRPGLRQRLLNHSHRRELGTVHSISLPSTMRYTGVKPQLT